MRPVSLSVLTCYNIAESEKYDPRGDALGTGFISSVVYVSKYDKTSLVPSVSLGDDDCLDLSDLRQCGSGSSIADDAKCSTKNNYAAKFPLIQMWVREICICRYIRAHTPTVAATGKSIQLCSIHSDTSIIFHSM